MIFSINDVTLRPPEPSDVDALYRYKNDPEVADRLVGFSTGYSKSDLAGWVEQHNAATDEALWVIANSENHCVGHVGLYQIDHRIGGAEFGILIGDRSFRGRGLGRACTEFCLGYGFNRLNLNRVHLRVLSTNDGAVRLYRRLGFRDEGCLRQAQFKHGRHVDVLLMSMLRGEFENSRDANQDTALLETSASAS